MPYRAPMLPLAAHPEPYILGDPGTLVARLTDDGKQVLQLLVQGRTGKEIAATLGVSPEIVRVHVENILAKLQVHSQVDPPPLPPAASAALAVPISAG